MATTSHVVARNCIEKTKLQRNRRGKERLVPPTNQKPIPAAARLKIIARTLITILKRLLIEHISTFRFSGKPYTKVTLPKTIVYTNFTTGAYIIFSGGTVF